MPVDMASLLTDLAAEHVDLDALIEDAPLDTPTPADGWSVGDTIAHLWFFDREATTALVDQDAFAAVLKEAIEEPAAYMSRTLDEGRALGERLPEVWRRTRGELIASLRSANPSEKVPWFGPPMSPASFATARLMEYWAHGQDVADALGRARPPSRRLRHICHLGVRTRGFSYAVRGMTAPATDVFVSLTAPDGETWTWGDPAATDSVQGPALDFCLVVTQRRLVGDTALQVTGAAATEWMQVAQIFAGGPTLTDQSRHALAAS